MRLASHFLKYLQEPQLLEKTSSCLLAHVRYKHAPKRLQEVSGRKKSECLEPCKVPEKKSFWRIFKSNKKDLKCLEKEKKPVRECETVEFVTEDQAECDMDNIAKMGGKVYRTCGTAYILQKDHIDQPHAPENSEEHILEEMMKDPSLKGQCDPMPAFQSVELKLIQLSERKLHPLYKKLMSIPKNIKPKASANSAPSYKTRSGPITPDELPPHLKINKEMFEKKNILYEFKMAEPPQFMLARMVEMKNNERPPLVKKVQQKEDCSKK